jgi:hypothetical protein
MVRETKATDNQQVLKLSVSDLEMEGELSVSDLEEVSGGVSPPPPAEKKHIGGGNPGEVLQKTKKQP